ncbi:MAG TPA: hypothetical protein VM554_01600 [Acidisarcina sp.]|nr:hypothetical protein [Acidisarcina sp.]
MLAQEVKMHEVSDMALREMMRHAGGFNPDAMGDACGGGCGRGASCSPRSEEMQAMLSGAD